MIYKSILFISILFFCTNCSVAQTAKNGVTYVTKKTVTGKAKNMYERGMKYNLNGVNDKALKDFEKALSIEPNFIDAQIQWAALKYESDDLEQAEIGFEKALAIDPTYKTKVLYTLGFTEWKMNKFAEAAEHFKGYIEIETKNEELLKKANRLMINCLFADKAYKNPVPFKPVNLGENVNTGLPEYLPSLTADGNMLIYTTRIRGQEDFYMSEKINGKWSVGRPMTKLNTPDSEGAQSVSADGKFIVFTACRRKNGYGGCDLFYSEFKNGKWIESKNMGQMINSKASERQPSISANGNVLYFSSDRGGGSGDYDIYQSTRDEKGNWTKPVNLGEKINTPYEDATPFIHADGSSLYFMSEGHEGLGGSDVFVSRRDENGNWGAPKNLGYPINTKAREGALIVSLDGSTAYFASDNANFNQKDSEAIDRSGLKETDIYSFELYPEIKPLPVTYVKAKIFDADTKKPLTASIEFKDLATGNVFAQATTESDGEFLICLPLGKNYALNVSKQQYLFYSDNFGLVDGHEASKPFELEIALQKIPDVAINNKIPSSSSVPLPTSKPIILKNVFFETGSASLRNESLFELNELKKLLEDYPKLKIQINGHTDNVGSDSDNLTLSEGRAKAVREYLINNSIDGSRLSYKGFGESTPIDTNDTEMGRQKNRRTEFVIIE